MSEPISLAYMPYTCTINDRDEERGRDRKCLHPFPLGVLARVLFAFLLFNV